MPELTREEKLKLIEKLPQRLQEFMYSENTGAALLYLGQKYNLPDKEVRLLSKLTGDVVLGITPIASLAQEINSNILPDPQTATILARELYSDVLAPALTPAVAPIAPATPRPVAPPAISTDHYREPAYAGKPAAGSPEVVDLRKTASLPPPLPIVPKPIPPPTPIIPKPPIVVAPKIPLIEAEPHKAPIPVPAPEPLSRMPQVILRSPGLPPVGSPRDILDLRKDKGEF